MEIENQDKRPVVWVARRLMRRGCNCESAPITYFASKARVQSVTKRFLKDGKKIKEYEVEFETPDVFEEIFFDRDMYAEMGYHVRYNSNEVFDNYIDALKCAKQHHEKLMAERITSLPRGYTDEIIEDAHRSATWARKLESYFDKSNNINQDKSKMF